ncbi:MAG: GNAT family N-acetyltransferase, partial [Clostridiales bacterium]|nr:GNAT family N-acetyltransferase [Clostridiales bacterium]
NYDKNINRNLTTNGIIIPYKKKKDVKIRCFIQNSVFRDNNRIPLTTADIEFDENQDYFIDDLCLFISVDNKVIGYGQIIYNKGIYTVVNLGIIKKYRGKGYGRDLLNALIILAERKGIRDLFIRVELNNHKAERLYESCGFNEVGYISNWIWTRTNY